MRVRGVHEGVPATIFYTGGIIIPVTFGFEPKLRCVAKRRGPIVAPFVATQLQLWFTTT